MNHNFFVAMLVISTLCSCSIKENRNRCPTLLILNINETSPSNPGKENHIKAGDDRTFYSISTPRGRQILKIKIKKGIYDICSYSSSEHWKYDKGRNLLVLEYGKQADSLYGGCIKAVCEEDSTEKTIDLFKQWCELTIKFKHPETWKSCLFEITGNWSAFSLKDFTPVKNKFCVSFDNPSKIKAKIPRQKDTGLFLEIYNSDNGKKGELLFSIPIGIKMFQEGYDWNREHLSDITLIINEKKQESSVSIEDWKIIVTNGI